MDIRPARADDQGDIVSCIYSSGSELYDFIYQTNSTTAEDFIAYEFASGRGFCGYRNVTVAVHEGKVVGTGCFYDGKQYKKLFLGSALNMVLFYGPFKIWGPMLRSNHISSVMKPPKDDELYLSNFGVSPRLRGKNIGSQIIKHWLDKAKSKGYRIFSLDVADTNPRAEKLYLSLGLAIIEFKKFTGKRAGMKIPNSKKMEMIL